MAQQTRPPVVTIMGHVDHGKTTLLDFIRKTNVTARESGGITQHIGAYQIEFQGKKITFIDTPGHAAFNKMRERGAQITDIVVLVVAANDGVKPQTIESIRHIKNSNVPVIVVVNKIDLPDVYPDMAKSQLVEQGILVQGFGGSVDVIELSAKTGKNVEKLLETIAITAELNELKADPDAPLEAVVIEATKDAKRGPVASVIVQQGTLSVRQDVTIDGAESRVRGLFDENGKVLNNVLPGYPAEIIGLNQVPAVGSTVRALNADYSSVTAEPEEEQLNDEYGDFNLDDMFGQKVKLKLIIRADVEGTLEAIKQNLDAESVELIDQGVGEVSEGDVEYAKTAGASILAFRVKVSKHIKELAKNNSVKIKSYDVIYHLIEDLQKQMLKLLEPTIDEVITGEAEIVQIFEMKGEKIAGSKVKTGQIRRIDRLHLKRNDEIVANPVIKLMMHGKEEVQEVKAKGECGITFKNKKLDFQVGDVIVAYKIEDEE